MANDQPKVRVDVAHRFGDVIVLDHVSFQVYENEFLCVVGPSGCGKTTMANLIAGLLQPTVGAVEIAHQPVNPRRHRISYVFQSRSCVPWRTVKDNVKIALELRGLSGAVADERATEALRTVGLTGFENYFPNQISGGMKQRVAIARAFCVDSELLIMDEPFGALDAQTRYLMQSEILRIWENMRRTVVFITNNVEEALFLADRVLVFSSAPAKVIKEISVDLPKPRNLTAASFLQLRRTISDVSEVAESA